MEPGVADAVDRTQRGVIAAVLEEGVDDFVVLDWSMNHQRELVLSHLTPPRPPDVGNGSTARRMSFAWFPGFLGVDVHRDLAAVALDESLDLHGRSGRLIPSPHRDHQTRWTGSGQSLPTPVVPRRFSPSQLPGVASSAFSW